MSFRISEIVLFSRTGERRLVELNIDGVTTILGDSRTGKSALIDIIDYCFGSDECHIASGPLRSAVSWYGLRLRGPESQLFIARRVPELHRRTSAKVYYETAQTVSIPQFNELRATTNAATLVSLLSGAAGITANVHEPPSTSTRPPLSANIRHGLLFSFQRQDEITSQRYLFHKQGEEFVPRAIRDVLPYFLGAVPEDYVARKNQLRLLQEQLRSVERSIGDLASIRSSGQTRASALLAEAEDAGLFTGARPADWEAVLSTLQAVVSQPFEQDADLRSGTALERFLSQRSQLLEEYRRIEDELAAVRAMVAEKQGFVAETSEQLGRLRAVELIGGESAAHQCPICHSELSADVPLVSEIRTSLETLSRQVARLSGDGPELQDLIDEFERRAAALRQALGANRDELEAIQASSDRARAFRDSAARRAHVLGRIGLYLESVPVRPDEQALQRAAEQLRRTIGALEEELDDDQIVQRQDSILGVIGRRLNRYAVQLNLEHSDNPLRLDVRQLTVVVDTPEGPLTLASNIGGGENWVGYHLVVHRVLHEWFVERNRPVPRFLFLDQPSQAYFLTESGQRSGDLQALSSRDRVAIDRMFRFIFDSVSQPRPGLQIIITEHADLQEEWFQNSVKHRWFGQEKLVPVSWLDAEAPA